jgi:hypothetical protein
LLSRVADNSGFPPRGLATAAELTPLFRLERVPARELAVDPAVIAEILGS